MNAERDVRVLVVDDDPRNVRLMEGIFRAAGYAVDHANDGESALASVAASPPDLVLLDVMMPGMSGHEVCRRLKEDPNTRPIPVVLVTSLSAIEDKVEGLDSGADDFVSKPVNRLELLAKTRSLMRVKALHDQVVAANRELERSNEELVRLERLKESLVQMIVHDLKNPLTSIMGNLHLLSQSETDRPDRTARRLELALDSSKAMMGMILNLLDIGRLEENRLVLAPRELVLGRVVDAALRECGGIVSSSSIRMINAIPAQLPAVLADEGLMARIVGNLLSNAIKHTPEGGEITVGGDRRGDKIVLWVRDTGTGIPKEFHALIFEKFRQAETRKMGLRTDHGLGLTFCKMAVEAHGGRIWVDSAPGRGSTFFIAVPIAPSAGGSPVPDEAAAPAARD